MGRSGQPRRRLFWWLGLAAGVLLAAAVTVLIWRRPTEDELQVRPGAARPPAAAGVAADPEYVIVGGVKRKRSDLQAERRENPKSGQSQQQHPLAPPPVKADANPNIESIVEALRTGEHPERLSPVSAPAPFNAARFAADPNAYLQVVEPGRVFQTAQPGPGVPVLKHVGGRMRRLTEGESVRLRVQGAPHAPISFLSVDGGQFQNQTTAITVRANADGIGDVMFLASAGTVGKIDILAGSPASTGQVRFLLHVAESPEGRSAPANPSASEPRGGKSNQLFSDQ